MPTDGDGSTNTALMAVFLFQERMARCREPLPHDTGDGIYDSAALIDRLVFLKNPTPGTRQR